MPSARTSQTTYLCGICNEWLKSKSARSSHKNSAHPRCPVCAKRFTDAKTLISHQTLTGHSFCGECKVRFSSPKEHLLHVRKVKHSKRYCCAKCNKEYPDQESLSRHCCQCDLVLKTKTKLARHKSTHLQMQPTAAPQAHVAHPACTIRLIHVAPQIEPSASRPYECQECNKRFAKQKSLAQHRENHKIIRCPASEKCKKFANLSALLGHLESGFCPSGLTAAEMKRLVFEHDAERLITGSEFESAIMTNATRYLYCSGFQVHS
jgi:hypothetical protein